MKRLLSRIALTLGLAFSIWGIAALMSPHNVSADEFECPDEVAYSQTDCTYALDYWCGTGLSGHKCGCSCTSMEVGNCGCLIQD